LSLAAAVVIDVPERRLRALRNHTEFEDCMAGFKRSVIINTTALQ